MRRVYALLQVALLLVTALVMLGLGFSALSALKGKCVSVASIAVCKVANTCLSALLFFIVAYYTLLWINKIRKNVENGLKRGGG
jgi:hypothetical protein